MMLLVLFVDYVSYCLIRFVARRLCASAKCAQTIFGLAERLKKAQLALEL